MNAKILAVLIVFATNFRTCQGKTYDDYVLYRTTPMEKMHLKFLQNLQTKNPTDVLFWRKPYKIYQDVQFIVKPSYVKEFVERAQHFALPVEELCPNVQSLFYAQQAIRRYTKYRTDTYTWDSYHTLADIYQWIKDVVIKYPKITELIHLGTSVENRDIYALSILRKRVKGTVIVEGGMHGNEWISTEFVTYLANSILHVTNDSSIDSRLLSVAWSYQWVFVPVVNPDGYEYSHGIDRLWRKNRRSHTPDIRGVDLNRNFNYSFCQFDASNNPADDSYCGPKPLSEPETVALAKLIANYASSLKYYFSIHAYGQDIIIPYGDKILHVDNYGDSENYGKQAIIKIYQRFGKKYSIGNSYDVLGHKISGDSASWVKSSFDVPFVYTFLLRDKGTYGYGLPPNEILPTCEEVQDGVLEIMTTNIKRLRADIFDNSRANRMGASGMLLSSLVVWLAK